MTSVFHKFKLVFIILLGGIATLPLSTFAQNSDLTIYQSNVDQLKANLQSHPNDPNLHFNLANNYWKLGQYEKSIKHYKETLKVQPFDAEAHTGIGFAYGKISQTSEAIHHYNEALKINPDDPKAHYRLGDEFINKGEFEKAKTYFKGATNLEPYFALAFNELAYVTAKLKDTQVCIKYYKQSLKLNRNDENAHQELIGL